MFTGLFVKMSNGANSAVVPFVNKRAIGVVAGIVGAGIVGAGGNAGAVLAGFLFKTSSLTYAQAFLILGAVIFASSVCALAVRFSETDAARQTAAPQISLDAVPVGSTGD
jgi:MFS transporter, NNP family, nitrate/nitrite transporter